MNSDWPHQSEGHAEWLLDFGDANSAGWQLEAHARNSATAFPLAIYHNRYVAVDTDKTPIQHFFVSRDLCHPGHNVYPIFTWTAPRDGFFSIRGQFGLRSPQNRGGAQVLLEVPGRIHTRTVFQYSEIAILELGSRPIDFRHLA